MKNACCFRGSSVVVVVGGGGGGVDVAANRLSYVKGAIQMKAS